VTDHPNLIAAHERTRAALVTGLQAIGQIGDGGAATPELVTTLSEAAQHWKQRAETAESAMGSNRANIIATLDEIGMPGDADTTGTTSLLATLCSRARRLYQQREGLARDLRAARLAPPVERKMPLFAGTYFHDKGDYAIVVDRQSRALTIDATGNTGTEINGTVVLNDAAALRAAAAALTAIAAHLDERPTT
jgi:hypothetical protein